MSSLLFLKSGAEIEMFMSSVICPASARKLQSISIARGHCFEKKTYEHLRSDCYICCCYICCCFLCCFLLTLEKHSRRKKLSEIFVLDKCK